MDYVRLLKSMLPISNAELNLILGVGSSTKGVKPKRNDSPSDTELNDLARKLFQLYVKLDPNGSYDDPYKAEGLKFVRNHLERDLRESRHRAQKLTWEQTRCWDKFRSAVFPAAFVEMFIAENPGLPSFYLQCLQDISARLKRSLAPVGFASQLVFQYKLEKEAAHQAVIEKYLATMAHQEPTGPTVG